MNGIPCLCKVFFRYSASAWGVGAPNALITRYTGLGVEVYTRISKDLDCLNRLIILVGFKSKCVIVSSGQRRSKRIVVKSMVKAVEYKMQSQTNALQVL